MSLSARSKRSFRQTVNQAGKFESREGSALSGAMSAISLFASQTVLITALLYYFGWVRTQATFGYFGVDPSLLGFTTIDYVLRSINSAFPPLIGLALVALLALDFHRWILARMMTASINTPTVRMLTTFISAAPWIGTILASVVLIGLMFPDRIGRLFGLTLPLILVCAVGILGYSGKIRLVQLATLKGKREDSSGGSQTRTRAVVLVTVSIVGILWWISLYAAQVGTREALDSVTTIPNRPEIILYSSERIALAGPGVIADEIQQAGSKYRYRYSGLRLLIQTGGRYILAPVGWRKGQDSIFLVPVSDTMRLDTIN
jgi:hypothetical protein